MEAGTTLGQPGGTNTASSDTGAAGGGNEGLSQAFDKAINEAKKTLELTTVKGADLYALKQSVR